MNVKDPETEPTKETFARTFALGLPMAAGYFTSEAGTTIVTGTWGYDSLVIVLVCLVVAYYLSRVEPGCKVPFHRVLILWAICAAAAQGVLLPLKVLIFGGYTPKVWWLTASAIPFALIAWIGILSVKRLERRAGEDE